MWNKLKSYECIDNFMKSIEQFFWKMKRIKNVSKCIYCPDKLCLVWHKWLKMVVISLFIKLTNNQTTNNLYKVQCSKNKFCSKLLKITENCSKSLNNVSRESAESDESAHIIIGGRSGNVQIIGHHVHTKLNEWMTQRN